MNFWDALLGGLKFYRRLRGGSWYQVGPKALPYMDAWVRQRGVYPNEMVWNEEHYR